MLHRPTARELASSAKVAMIVKLKNLRNEAGKLMMRLDAPVVVGGPEPRA